MESVMTTARRALGAARSLRAVLNDPNDTQQVFRLLDAVAGGTSEAFRRRFARSRGGERLLADRPDLFATLSDRARLATMPAGSLGRAYVTFMTEGGLDAAWLVNASATAAPPREDELRAYIEDRLRDSHDLWHVVTGYGGDVLGEGALLAFTFAQTFNAGVGLLVSTGLVVGEDPDARRLLVDGFARGARAAWFPAIYWEELLDQPLDAVRERLRVGAPPRYEPVHARDLPPGGLLSPQRGS